MLLRWFLSIIVYAVALIVVDQLFEAVFIDSFLTAVLASVVISALNLVVRPILVFFTLPITVITLGLFLIVINAITLMIAQWLMGDIFVIEGFGMAIIASIIISILTMLLNRLVVDTVK